MLILTRKLGESINIGSEIKVFVVDVRRNQVRLGIEAPIKTAVHRSEVYERIKQENLLAAERMKKSNVDSLSRILSRKTESKRSVKNPLVLKNFSDKEDR